MDRERKITVRRQLTLYSTQGFLCATADTQGGELKRGKNTSLVYKEFHWIGSNLRSPRDRVISPRQV